MTNVIIRMLGNVYKQVPSMIELTINLILETFLGLFKEKND